MQGLIHSHLRAGVFGLSEILLKNATIAHF